MTSVVLCSAKGAPGVTTLSCLLGAVWPISSPVVVAECDPSGGDLIARFGCDSQVGMASLVLAARHGPAGVAVGPHLQQLPGGLDVLVGGPNRDAARNVDAELSTTGRLFEMQPDFVVDCGRVDPEAPGQQFLLSRADAVLIIGTGDVASAVHAASLVARLAGTVAGALGLAVVGGRPANAAAIAGAVGAELAGLVAVDPGTAAVVRGEPGGRRRIIRSPLVESSEGLRRWIVQKVVDGSTSRCPDLSRQRLAPNSSGPPPWDSPSTRHAPGEP